MLRHNVCDFLFIQYYIYKKKKKKYRCSNLCKAKRNFQGKKSEELRKNCLAKVSKDSELRHLMCLLQFEILITVIVFLWGKVTNKTT